jgi:putative flavoprotein involved in K+ transport
MNDALGVLVIGGGQAGLAMGHHLARGGSRFLILDAGAQIGQAWRTRWDSLRLFTPPQYDNLPGLPFPAAPDTYPGKDAVADYLQTYATQSQLPVRLGTTVTSLTSSDGRYVAKAADQEVQARQVVVATGPFQVPFIPALADHLDPPYPRSTAGTTGAPTPSHRERSSLSALETPAARSRWSCRPPTASNCPSPRRSPPCPSGRWAVTSGGGPPRWD